MYIILLQESWRASVSGDGGGRYERAHDRGVDIGLSTKPLNQLSCLLFSLVLASEGAGKHSGGYSSQWTEDQKHGIQNQPTLVSVLMCIEVTRPWMWPRDSQSWYNHFHIDWFHNLILYKNCRLGCISSGLPYKVQLGVQLKSQEPDFSTWTHKLS